MSEVAEFLRKLADVIDSANSSNDSESCDTCNDEVTDSTDIMVPPLQQQIELLKKLSGVNSVFDEKTVDDEKVSHEIGDAEKKGAALMLTAPYPSY